MSEVRNLYVILSANAAAYKAAMAGASRDTDQFGRHVDQAGDNVRKLDSELDRVSTRLRLYTDLAAAAGPALVPLGAAAVPMLSTMANQLGAVAGGIGVTVLAVQGLGDGLEALNKAKLAPTAENLAALHTEMERLGPDAESFLRYLDALEPQMRALQATSRAGMLPDFEDGIDAVLERLPQVQQVVAEISGAVGGLAAGAGESLAGENWDRFFEFLDDRAAPILTEFGQTVGHFALGLADMLVAFDPVSRGFSAGLLDMSKSFAEWSAGLDQNQTFQEFLDYIREAGPQALDFLGEFMEAFAGIAAAAGPVGTVVLPVLTKVLDVVGSIADSDLGTPIIAGMAALGAYNRVLAVTASLQGRMAVQGGLLGAGGLIGGAVGGTKSSLGAVRADVEALGAAWLTAGARTEREQARMASSAKSLRSNLGGLAGEASRVAGPIAGLAVASSGTADSIGLTNTATLGLMGTIAGPWGAAVGAGVGLTMDLAAANDDLWEAIERVHSSLETAPATDAGLTKVRADLEAAEAQFTEFVETYDKGWGIRDLGNVIGNPGDALSVWKNDVEGVFGASDIEEADAALAELREEEAALAGSMRFTNLSAEQQSAALNAAADAAQAEADTIRGELIGAMRELRSERLRNANAQLNYKASILDARDALKANGRTVNENTRAGQANLQALYSLASAWNAQGNGAKNATGAMRAARANFVETATAMGMPIEKARELANRLLEIPTKRVIKVTLNGAESAMGKLYALRDLKIGDKVIRIHTVRTDGGEPGYVSGGTPRRTTEQADGGVWSGGTRRFANGGFGANGRYYDRVPMIAEGGANILWGEEETGWEAYVSGKPSQRGRNVGILGEAASRFGYDLSPRGRQPVSGGQTVVHNHYHAPKSLDLVLESGQKLKAYVRGHAGAAIADHDEVQARHAGNVGRMNWPRD